MTKSPDESECKQDVASSQRQQVEQAMTAIQRIERRAELERRMKRSRMKLVK